MAVVPVTFAITKQDLRVLSALCDTALNIYGAEKSGIYTVTMRFSTDSVSMSVMNSNNYKSPKEKILYFILSVSCLSSLKRLRSIGVSVTRDPMYS